MDGGHDLLHGSTEVVALALLALVVLLVALVQLVLVALVVLPVVLELPAPLELRVLLALERGSY